MNAAPAAELSVALGGGGTKCFAQIGVLRAIESGGFRVGGLACTSAGAMVGAAYAAGRSLDEIEAVYAKHHHEGRLRAARRAEGAGLFSLASTVEAIDTLIGDLRFEDLDIPLVLTSVDLDRGRALPLREGPLRDAVRAAIAIPGLFPPASWRGRTLVDGGVLDPIPVALARSLAPEAACLAVILSPPLVDWEGHPARKSSRRHPWLRPLLRLRQARALGLFVRSSEMTHRQLAEERLAIDMPEITVRPEVPHAELFGASDPSALVAAGKAAAEAALGAYRAEAEIARAWREAERRADTDQPAGEGQPQGLPLHRPLG